MMSGYTVPNNTAAVATTSITLLVSKNDSREIQSKRPPKDALGARHANKVNDAPTTKAKKIKMNTPRLGSDANACTDVNTPERTKNVPSSESENAAIANNTVHALKPPRFSVTINEWINAVAANQGMSDAFSTGSQNHQPPQPSS